MGLFDNVLGSLEGAAGQAVQQNLAPMLTQACEQAVAGGMPAIMAKLQASGLGGQVTSWAGDIAGHLPISPAQLQSALGDEHITSLASHLGIPMDQVTAMLVQHLPAMSQQSA